jgi:alkylation response protein AidB-like acyl-CoA dehydrogenase
MREYEICRLYADARVLRIYGGTSETMRADFAESLAHFSKSHSKATNERGL